MSAAWAAVLVASAAQLAGAAILAWKAGRWAGSVNASLDELRRIGRDHEKRLRVLQGGRRGSSGYTHRELYNSRCNRR